MTRRVRVRSVAPESNAYLRVIQHLFVLLLAVATFLICVLIFLSVFLGWTASTTASIHAAWLGVGLVTTIVLLVLRVLKCWEIPRSMVSLTEYVGMVIRVFREMLQILC